MPNIKSLSDAAIVRRVSEIEELADDFFFGQPLFRRKWNLGVWASLTEVVRQTEVLNGGKRYGSVFHQVTLMNLGRIAAEMCRACRRVGDRTNPTNEYRWWPSLAKDAANAFNVAGQYSSFCAVFPFWHQDYYAAELIDHNTVRFFADIASAKGRVSAYQKGFRPKALIGEKANDRPVLLTAKVEALFAQAQRRNFKKSEHGVDFGTTMELLRELQFTYADRLANLFRRAPELSLGVFNLEDFRKFYSALLAIAAAHEHLCYRWLVDQRALPYESLVIHRSREKWIETLSTLSGLAGAVVSEIISDMTFGRFHSHDLQLLPFVPLDESANYIALPASFPLISNWEENILRSCSYLRPSLYSETTLFKEGQMREAVQQVVKSPRTAVGPITIQKGIPDLDLLIRDEAEGVLILAELKWPRKPVGVRERRERDAELVKGVSQIKAIRDHLLAHPTKLSDRGYVAKHLNEYKVVFYCVVSRDHLIESPNSEFPIVGYDALLHYISKAKSLFATSSKLKSMAWLPSQDRDYTVADSVARVGPVSIVSDIFYPTNQSGLLQNR